MTPATPLHAAAMAVIHAEAFPDDPWSEHSFATLLSQPGVTGFIDARGGIVLLRCVLDEAEILTIGVGKTRLGIGSALMQTAIAYAQSLNIDMLHLEVAATNTAACALYHSLGFKQTGRRKNYYPNGADALILSLKIGQAKVF